MKFILPILCGATLIFGVLLYNEDAITMSDQNARLSIRIWVLEEKIYQLERINDKLRVLEQILTPQMMDELEALNEYINQTATGGNQKGD